MAKYGSRALRFTAAILAGGMHVLNPASAQNINDFPRMYGGVTRQAMRQAAQPEWRRLPPSEISCLEQGGSVDALINRGVLLSDPRLSQLALIVEAKSPKVLNQPPFNHPLM